MGGNIVINADDFGKCNSINDAILEAFNRKLISSTTIMCNMCGFHDAINKIYEYNLHNRVGIHLNISEGQPISDKIKNLSYFCDNEGRFISRKYNLKEMLRIPTKEELSALKEEIYAQIKLCRENGLELTHIDSHHHKHVELYMFLILKEIMKESKINNVRLARINKDNGRSIKNMYRTYYNFYLRNKFKINKIDEFIYFKDLAKVENIANKNIEIMCHPQYKLGDIYDGEEKLEKKIEKLNNVLEFKLVNYSDLL